MKIYVLRHGETDMNAENLIQGHTDVPLNELGKQQAKSAAEKIALFSEENRIDEIICSPLTRARQTAQAVADEIEKESGRKIHIQIDERLIEQCYGELEGTSRLSAEFAQSKKELTYPTGETGESHFKLAQRTYNLLDEICACKAKNVLLVTHGGICRVIATYFNKMTVEEYANWRALNCQIDVYDY